MPKFIKNKIKSDSDSDLDLHSEVESKSDAKLMEKIRKVWFWMKKYLNLYLQF